MAAASHLLIANLELHDELSDEEKEALLGVIGPEKEAPAGTNMIRQGDRLWQSTVLLSGYAVRYQVQPQGQCQITAIHIPGDFIDLHSFLLKTMDHSVAAATSCTYATVSHDALKDITIRQPHLTRLLWLKTVIDGAILRKWMTVGSERPRARCAHLVCELAMRLRSVGLSDGLSFPFPLVEGDLGDMLRLNSTEMNSALTELANDELIEWDLGIVTIKDWERLMTVADFDDLYLNLQHERR